MKKAISWILLCAMFISIFLLYACDSSDDKKQSEDVKVTKENFYDYFSVTVEFQNVQWSTKYNSYFNQDYYGATADMHIKITNKKNIEGVTVKLDIDLVNNGNGLGYWIDAKRDGIETISKTIEISPHGVTDISIPRATTDDNLSYRVAPPSEKDIKIIIVEVTTDNHT